MAKIRPSERDTSKQCEPASSGLVDQTILKDEWEDADENERTTFKIEARRVGILPFRLASVTLSQKPANGDSEPVTP
ncbi:hypothetical protein [Xanthomonas citri]|uniref:hypothetical protein n=1 Tax=Xanthomonas citri TaxID=346 RepID=UPI000A735778